MSNPPNNTPWQIWGIVSIFVALITIAPTIYNSSTNKENNNKITAENDSQTLEKKDPEDSKKIYNEEKKKVDNTIRKYLDTYERALKKNDISILPEVMSGEALEVNKRRISDNYYKNQYLISSHTNIELINVDFRFNYNEADAKITFVYEAEAVSYEDRKCRGKVPEDNLVMHLVLEKDNNIWKVIQAHLNNNKDAILEPCEW